MLTSFTTEVVIIHWPKRSWPCSFLRLSLVVLTRMASLAAIGLIDQYWVLQFDLANCSVISHSLA